MQHGDLFNYLCQLASQPADENTAKNIIRQISKAVKVLHSNNILHRDIKIENILVSGSMEQPVFKLADLGSATKLASKNATTTVGIGTPGYTAPEVYL